MTLATEKVKKKPLYGAFLLRNLASVSIELLFATERVVLISSRQSMSQQCFRFLHLITHCLTLKELYCA